MIKNILLLLTGLVLGGVLGYYFRNASADSGYKIELKAGEEIDISLVDVNHNLELKSTGGDVIIGIVTDDNAVVGHKISSTKKVETYFWTEQDGLRATTTDIDSDGNPDFRLIRGREMGSAYKEVPEISWESSK